MVTRRRTIAAAVLSLALVAAACGGGESDTATDEPDVPEEEQGEVEGPPEDADDAAAPADDDSAEESPPLDDPEAEAYAAAFTEAMGGDATDRCLANGYVDAVGVEALRDALEPDEIADADFDDLGVELTEERADAFVAGVATCFDEIEMFAGESASDAERACIESELDDELRREFVVSMLAPGGDALVDPVPVGERIGEIIVTCAEG